MMMLLSLITAACICLYTATATCTSYQRIIRLMADVILCVVERERKRDRNMDPPVDEDG